MASPSGPFPTEVPSPSPWPYRVCTVEQPKRPSTQAGPFCLPDRCTAIHRSFPLTLLHDRTVMLVSTASAGPDEIRHYTICCERHHGCRPAKGAPTHFGNNGHARETPGDLFSRALTPSQPDPIRPSRSTPRRALATNWSPLADAPEPCERGSRKPVASVLAPGARLEPRSPPKPNTAESGPLHYGSAAPSVRRAIDSVHASPGSSTVSLSRATQAPRSASSSVVRSTVPENRAMGVPRPTPLLTSPYAWHRSYDESTLPVCRTVSSTNPTT
jgi:hypothetical protein